MARLLLIEDDPIMGESLVQRFELEGFGVQWCKRASEVPDWVARDWDLVVSDVRLPDGDMSKVYASLTDAQRATPWIFLTGYASVDDAVVTVRAGARDYLTKPFDIERLVELAHEAAGRAGDDLQTASLGISREMQRVETLARRLAKQRSSVLITGESGTGKEVVARMIHNLDPRPGNGEFVAVNCAAIPEQMLEAEFFGFERGAFTGAVRAHRGYFERADGGTVFLDEVAELPATMQAKLLRVLQDRSFYRIGGERIIRGEFRVIAATNRDLVERTRSGAFREDLFYRLAVIRIALPPLRERPEDIRWLAERFLRELGAEQRRTLAVSDEFYRMLMSYPWLGNARELRAWLEQAVIMSDNGVLDALLFDHGSLLGEPRQTETDEQVAPLQAVVEQAERNHIRKALSQSAGSISRTAKMLGISRKTLWEKMRRLGVESVK